MTLYRSHGIINVLEKFSSEEEAEQYKADYLATFPTGGYDTQLSTAPARRGGWVVHGWRSHTCD